MYTNLSAENVAAKTAYYLLTLGDSRVRCSFMGQKLITGLFWWPADMSWQRTATNKQDRSCEFDYDYRKSSIKPPSN